MDILRICDLEKAIKEAKNGDEVAQDRKLTLIARMEAERGKRATDMVVASIEGNL